MTDWSTTGSGDISAAADLKYGFSDAAGCIKAGNDLIMPGSQADIDSILRAVDAADDEVPCPITRAELQACARRILNMVVYCEQQRRNA